MDRQRHIIKRQVIELKVRSSVQARLYQDELSRIYRQRVIPLIDKRCSELAGPDRLYRLETLELDLGTLDLEDLEEDFTQKVDAALYRELARQIEENDRAADPRGESSKVQSHLELFALFARTGSLPWWAEPSRPGLLAENLEQLLRESPGALRRLLEELARESAPRQRMINHYTDEQLAVLCGLLLPAHAEVLKRDVCELIEALQTLQAESPDLPRQIRQSLWNNLLLVAGTGGERYAALAALYRAVLKRVAADAGRTDNELMTGLYQVIQHGRIPVDRRLSEVITELAEAGTGMLTPDETLARRLVRLQAERGSLYESWMALSAILPQLPTRLQAELLALLEQLPSGESRQSIAARVLQVLEAGDAQQEFLAADSNALRQASAETLKAIRMFRSAAGDVSTSDQAALGAAVPVGGEILPEQVGQELPRKEKGIDLSFSETEELSVGNSGLVILWPFLVHFFTHLQLLDKDRLFKDAAARHRAAGLLQVVAAQEASPPEYLLPLNKLLCGLQLMEVFDFGLPLLESEAEECTRLLEALIVQTPILRNMSVEGFRGTFLLRPGLLTTRDGMWVLHVERQTYDVVLERFPWTWEWVKLPWMEAPLQVEW